jgi:hypothetical protein
MPAWVHMPAQLREWYRWYKAPSTCLIKMPLSAQQSEKKIRIIKIVVHTDSTTPSVESLRWYFVDNPEVFRRKILVIFTSNEFYPWIVYMTMYQCTGTTHHLFVPSHSTSPPPAERDHQFAIILPQQLTEGFK